VSLRPDSWSEPAETPRSAFEACVLGNDARGPTAYLNVGHARTSALVETSLTPRAFTAGDFCQNRYVFDPQAAPVAGTNE